MGGCELTGVCLRACVFAPFYVRGVVHMFVLFLEGAWVCI